METKVFNFRVNELAWGWSMVTLEINGKVINFDASYLGPEPLATFVTACAKLQDEGDKYSFTWFSEPGDLRFELSLLKNKELSFDVIDKETGDEFSEKIPFNIFFEIVKSEAWRVLSCYGLRGYYASWCDDSDFPIASLLCISGSFLENKGEFFGSNISEEIAMLQKNIFKG